ncbi:hypothetical protein EI555_005578, partial [Monodon monoceros]
MMVSKRDPTSQEIRHFSVTVCLVPICSLCGAAVTTVKGVGSIKMRLHPMQERTAESHGTRCRICTPGMVMSMYTLPRSHPQHSEEQLPAALGGSQMVVNRKEQENAAWIGEKMILPRSTGKICMELFAKEEFQPLDLTQELTFPPELLRMARNPEKRTLAFHGKSVTWISPGTLKDLLELKAKHLSSELIMVSKTSDGLTIGAACLLAQVKDILAERVSEFREKTQTHQAFLKHLKSLAGRQIWNVASLGGHIISRHRYSDLNPFLAKCHFLQQIPLSEHFLAGLASADLEPEGIAESAYIPHSQKAQCQQNALAHVNAGRQVLFREGTDTVEDLSIAYRGVGAATVSAQKSCQQLLGRCWGELMLDEACRLLLDELSLPGWAPGGRVAFERTLVVSFFFKFYLQVLQEQKKLVELFSVPNRCRYPEISDRFLSALEDFPVTVPQGIQRYQSVDSHQPLQDPVGCPIMHLSGLKHAIDEAIFCDDIFMLDKELSMALVTSTKAHAKIISIDLSEALELPGVVDVIRAEDIPGTSGTLRGPDHLCCGCRDRCTGKARKKIKVTCEELEPIIFTIEEKSMLEDRNRFTWKHSECLLFQRQRTKNCVNTGSSPRAENSVLYFKHPINRITCHVKRVGGGLGGKVGGPAVSGLLQLWALSDDMLITGRRQPLFGKYKVGFMNNGRIKALDIECFINGGCTLEDSEQVCASETSTVLLCSRISYTEAEKCIYKIPNLRFQGHAYLTNLPSDVAFHGSGFPQGTLVTESCITAVAAKCGLPPEEIREKNMYGTVDKTIYKQAFNPETLIRCWNECLDKSSFHNRRIRELKIPMSYMHICETSTAMEPNTIATAASIGSDVNGRGVQNACQILLKHLKPIIKKNPEGTCKDWAFMDWEKGKGDPFSYYVYGAACSKIESDCLTGAHKKIRTDIVMDACCSQNPATDIRQVYLFREWAFIPLKSVLYSRGPDEYRIPTISDVPEELNVSTLPSSQTPLTIYSS